MPKNFQSSGGALAPSDIFVAPSLGRVSSYEGTPDTQVWLVFQVFGMLNNLSLIRKKKKQPEPDDVY